MAKEEKELLGYETLVHAIAGATGSVIAMGTFYPLDTVRSRLQLEENREAKNTFKVLQDLVKEEGIGTLYRGIVPVLESLCTSNFIYFYTFHGLKSLKGHSSQQNAGSDLLLASVAGVVNVLLTSPLWVVNTRLKMQGIRENSNNNYSGLLDGILYISRKEGLSTLWSGTIPSLLLVANPSIHFMTYEALKRRLLSTYRPKEISAWTYFVLGAMSKAVATILTYPLQLLQTKLRHGHSYRGLPPDAGMISLALYIVRNFGLSGLYKGLESKILQTISTAALMFGTYEKIAGLIIRMLMKTQSKIYQ